MFKQRVVNMRADITNMNIEQLNILTVVDNWYIERQNDVVYLISADSNMH